MRDKEMIEEIVEVMGEWATEYKMCWNVEHATSLAKWLMGWAMSQGYRKLPKDSVVLSREEYEKLKSLYDTQKGAIMTSSIGDLPLTVEGIRKAVDEITRLNRVETELQELNAKYYNEAKDLRREVNRLKAHAKINDEHLHIRIKNQERKETAEKFLNMIYWKAVKHIKGKNKDECFIEMYFEKLDELAKEQFGVEIKE